MDFETIQRMAIDGKRLPSFSPSEEQMAWCGLRGVYLGLKGNVMTKTEATKHKIDIRREMDNLKKIREREGAVERAQGIRNIKANYIISELTRGKRDGIAAEVLLEKAMEAISVLQGMESNPYERMFAVHSGGDASTVTDVPVQDFEEMTESQAAEERARVKKKKKKEEAKHKYGEYGNVLLTDEEYRKLCDMFGDEINLKILELDEGIASKGYKYKSHYAAIRAWDRRDKKDTVPKTKQASYDIDEYEKRAVEELEYKRKGA